MSFERASILCLIADATKGITESSLLLGLGGLLGLLTVGENGDEDCIGEDAAGLRSSMR